MISSKTVLLLIDDLKSLDEDTREEARNSIFEMLEHGKISDAVAADVVPSLISALEEKNVCDKQDILELLKMLATNWWGCFPESNSLTAAAVKSGKSVYLTLAESGGAECDAARDLLSSVLNVEVPPKPRHHQVNPYLQTLKTMSKDEQQEFVQDRFAQASASLKEVELLLNAFGPCCMEEGSRLRLEYFLTSLLTTSKHLDEDLARYLAERLLRSVFYKQYHPEDKPLPEYEQNILQVIANCDAAWSKTQDRFGQQFSPVEEMIGHFYKPLNREQILSI